MRHLLLAAALLFSLACSKSSPPPAQPELAAEGTPPAEPPPPEQPALTCEVAIDHAIKLLLTSEDFAALDEQQRKDAGAMVEGMRGEMLEKCREDRWTPEQLQCVLDQTRIDDMVKCDLRK